MYMVRNYNSKFHKYRTELPIDYQKYVIGDYVSGPDSCAKFGVNPSMRARGQMGEI